MNTWHWIVLLIVNAVSCVYIILVLCVICNNNWIVFFIRMYPRKQFHVSRIYRATLDLSTAISVHRCDDVIDH